MDTNCKINFLKTLQVLLFVLIPTIMFAPPIPPAPGGSVPATTPIDGGIYFLLIAGISFGVYQIIQLRKKQLI